VVVAVVAAAAGLQPLAQLLLLRPR